MSDLRQAAQALLEAAEEALYQLPASLFRTRGDLNHAINALRNVLSEKSEECAFEKAEEICRKHGEHHRRGGSSEEVVNACFYLAGRMKYERAELNKK